MSFVTLPAWAVVALAVPFAVAVFAAFAVPARFGPSAVFAASAIPAAFGLFAVFVAFAISAAFAVPAARAEKALIVTARATVAVTLPAARYKEDPAMAGELSENRG
ncbi:hypothetical protein [Streptosporangium subroseum]|uniref:hypothetical protein n=1 Tax=Streptosporangium subroseum TaxID=106412 RepID=UPI00308E7C85|nr:hypothetical protein OHB15_43005 [Streptosporangium subroseum]